MWAIVALGAFLLLTRLDGRVLWQDEAESALLAKSILATGLPLGFDGRNVVDQEAIADYQDGDYRHRWHPWLPFYAEAASFAAFGASTWSARLPSAVCGVLTIIATYMLALRIFHTPWAARMSALILACNVQFLLFSRQARWPAFAFLAVTMLLIGFDRLRNRESRATLYVVFAWVALFYSNYLIAICFAVGIAILASIELRERSQWLRLILAGAFCLALATPGIVFHRVLTREHQSAMAAVVPQIGRSLVSVATFVVPVAILLVAVVLALLKPASGLKRAVSFLMLPALAVVAITALSPWGVPFRYLSVALPLGAVLAGGTIAALGLVRKPLAAVALLLLLLTDTLHIIPFAATGTPGSQARDRGTPLGGGVHSPFVSFLGELTEPPDDPEARVARYLSTHARPTDVVVATYGDLSLQFYTGLVVIGGMQGRPVPREPDWILVRSGILDDRPGHDLTVLQELQASSPTWKYELAPIDDADCLLCGNPDPLYHRYRNVPDAAPMSLYRKRQALP